MTFSYVPTITSQKDIPTQVEGITSCKISFCVEIFEKTQEGNEHIGTASVVIGGPESLLLYIRIVTKYEDTTYSGSVYSNYITEKELKTEHAEIVEECKKLREAWGW